MSSASSAFRPRVVDEQALNQRKGGALVGNIFSAGNSFDINAGTNDISNMGTVRSTGSDFASGHGSNAYRGSDGDPSHPSPELTRLMKGLSVHGQNSSSSQFDHNINQYDSFNNDINSNFHSSNDGGHGAKMPSASYNSYGSGNNSMMSENSYEGNNRNHHNVHNNHGYQGGRGGGGGYHHGGGGGGGGGGHGRNAYLSGGNGRGDGGGGYAGGGRNGDRFHNNQNDRNNNYDHHDNNIRRDNYTGGRSGVGRGGGRGRGYDSMNSNGMTGGDGGSSNDFNGAYGGEEDFQSFGQAADSSYTDDNVDRQTVPSGFVCMVHFKRSHRYFLVTPNLESQVVSGSFVIVEADRGEDLGIVGDLVPAERFWAIRFAAISKKMLKNILRLASRDEVQSLVTKTEEEIVVTQICQEILLTTHPLPIDIVDAEYQFDRNKLTIYHDSPKRNDFRGYVRDLFCVFKTRIWMQQMDAKVEAHPVSTRMTSENYQDLLQHDDQFLLSSLVGASSTLNGVLTVAPAIPSTNASGAVSNTTDFGGVFTDLIGTTDDQAFGSASIDELVKQPPSQSPFDIAAATFSSIGGDNTMGGSIIDSAHSATLDEKTFVPDNKKANSPTLSDSTHSIKSFHSVESTEPASTKTLAENMELQMREIAKSRAMLHKEKEEVDAARAKLREEENRLMELRKSIEYEWASLKEHKSNGEGVKSM